MQPSLFIPAPPPPGSWKTARSFRFPSSRVCSSPAQSALHSPFVSVFNSCSFFSPRAKGHLCREAFPGSPVLCGPPATSNTQLLWRGDAPTFQKALDHTFARSWWESAAVPCSLCRAAGVAPLLGLSASPRDKCTWQEPSSPICRLHCYTLIVRVGAGPVIGQVGLWGLHGETLDTVSGGAATSLAIKFPSVPLKNMRSNPQ